MGTWEDFFDPSIDSRRITRGNRIEHLPHDDRTISEIWQAIEQAEKFIWISMYIFEPDAVGHATIERLAEAGSRGCQVLLLYDQFGSFRLRKKHLAPLHAQNTEVAIFNPFWPPWTKRGRLTIRNHRKLVIVDGKQAFCGGMNLSEEFAGLELGEWVFDDTMVRAEGPCVHYLSTLFMRTWEETAGTAHPLPEPPPEPLEDNVPVQVLETDPRRSDTKLREVISKAISLAEERCYLTSPYFVPPRWLLDALTDAAGRGVDVQILTSGETDMPIARASARHGYGPLFAHGARIHEHTARILHSKTLTIDGLFGLVGSYNMDQCTSRHVLDLGLAALAPDLAAALEEEFFDNLEQSREVAPEAWSDRSWLARTSQKAAHAVYRRI